jgi:hypothetical protein
VPTSSDTERPNAGCGGTLPTEARAAIEHVAKGRIRKAIVASMREQRCEHPGPVHGSRP